MKRIFLPIAAVLFLSVFVLAQNVGQKYESLTIGASAKAITAATLLSTENAQLRECTGRLETAQVRYRFDGTDPTSSEGHLLEIGDEITIRGYTNLKQFRAIRTGDVSAVLKLTCSAPR